MFTVWSVKHNLSRIIEILSRASAIFSKIRLRNRFLVAHTVWKHKNPTVTGLRDENRGILHASPRDTVSYNMPVRKQGVISVDRRTPIWPPARQDSWLGPTRGGGGQEEKEEEEEGSCCVSNGHQRVHWTYGKVMAVEIRECLRGGVKTSSACHPGCNIWFSCSKSRLWATLSIHIYTYNRRGKSIFFFFPSPLPCPAACSGYTVRLFLAAQSAPALSWLS